MACRNALPAGSRGFEISDIVVFVMVCSPGWSQSLQLVRHLDNDNLARAGREPESEIGDIQPSIGSEGHSGRKRQSSRDVREVAVIFIADHLAHAGQGGPL